MVFIKFFHGSAIYTDMLCHVTSIPVILGLHIRHIGTSSRPGSKRCAPTYLVYTTISTLSLCANQVEFSLPSSSDIDEEFFYFFRMNKSEVEELWEFDPIDLQRLSRWVTERPTDKSWRCPTNHPHRNYRYRFHLHSSKAEEFKEKFLWRKTVLFISDGFCLVTKFP